MKVLIDTNVFASYLLASSPSGTISTVVRTCLEHDEIELLVPPPQIQELADTLTTKRCGSKPKTSVVNCQAQRIAWELK